MNSEKSKRVLVIIAAACLAVSGFLFFYNKSGGDDRSSTRIPMCCMDCGHTYELPIREYQGLITQQASGEMAATISAPRVSCPGCGKVTAQAGIRCSGCNSIFVVDSRRNPRLECPKCGKSNL